MYTLVRVRPAGHDCYCWTGHIYDISETGMRFELDEQLPAGTKIEVCAMLPGCDHLTFSAVGCVVRLHDEEDERGPMRMGMVFESFQHQLDHQRLSHYLSDHGLQAA